MKGISPRNDDDRAFLKTFDALGNRHSRWQVWCDFVNLFALSIVNTVDSVHREEREKRYLNIIRPYNEEEVKAFCQLAAITTAALDNNPRQDFLGELFIRCELGNKAHGQCFTPYHMCHMMAEITLGENGQMQKAIEDKGYITVNDPACGAGATLIAAANVFLEKGINYQQTVVFAAQDIDQTVAMMCYIQLSLLGCAGYVRVGNTLTDPDTGHPLYGDGSINTYYTPLYYLETWNMRREIDAFKRLFRSIEPSFSDEEKPEEDSQKPEPVPIQEEEKPKPEADAPLIIQVGKKKGKKNEGQLMFDFGIGG